MNHLIQRLVSLQAATKDLDTIGRRDLLEHDLILQQITNLTGEPTIDCYLPEDQLETTYAEQLGENAAV
ncbi:MAG: hypothetical protein LC775_07660, partial [Acidobacteria bacterium]|nr:hypothetical protein [Acidobacteriota bacterium]